jgi:hypothetical protein
MGSALALSPVLALPHFALNWAPSAPIRQMSVLTIDIFNAAIAGTFFPRRYADAGNAVRPPLP